MYMGPNSNTPNYNQMPTPAGNRFEQGQNVPPQYNVGPNTTFNRGPEQFNQAPLNTGEHLAQAEQLAQPTQAIPTAQPIAAASAQPTVPPATPTKTVDPKQMEHVWVGRAKQTIEATQDNPYEQAHQIAMLMQGYLREKYGKIVGSKK